MIKETPVQYAGLTELKPDEQETVQKLVKEYTEKILRKVHNVTMFHVHLKTYKKEGAKPKFSAHIRCIAPAATFESCNADGWELHLLLHKAFEEIIHQIDHKLHTDVSRPTL